METSAKLLMTGILMLLVISSAASAGEIKSILEKILPTAVQIKVEKSGHAPRLASGVAIGSRKTAAETHCYILSAGHVFFPDTGAEILVYFDRYKGSGTARKATLIYRNEENPDLAALRAEGDCITAELGHAELGTEIVVLGFPFGNGLRVSQGIVSQLRLKDDPEKTQFLIDSNIAAGISGGGIYVRDTGRLIGIIEGYQNVKIQAQGKTEEITLQVPLSGWMFATSIDDAVRALTKAGLGHILSK